MAQGQFLAASQFQSIFSTNESIHSNTAYMSHTIGPTLTMPPSSSSIQSAVQSNRQAAADPTAGLGGGALAPLRAANLHANHCSKILKSPLNLHANQYLYCFSPPLSPILHPAL